MTARAPSPDPVLAALAAAARAPDEPLFDVATGEQVDASKVPAGSDSGPWRSSDEIRAMVEERRRREGG
jgi:hypothetical protein